MYMVHTPCLLNDIDFVGGTNEYNIRGRLCRGWEEVLYRGDYSERTMGCLH